MEQNEPNPDLEKLKAELDEIFRGNFKKKKTILPPLDIKEEKEEPVLFNPEDLDI